MSTRPLRLTAHLSLSSSTAVAKFSGIAYSGGLVPGHGAFIDLAMTTVAPRLHLLHEHDRTNIIGVVDGISNTGDKLTVSGRLFSDLPGTAAERIAEQARRGSPFELSVGVFNYAEEPVLAGQTRRVNARALGGPTTILRGGQIREVSVVALGADVGTSVQIFGAGGRSTELAALFAEVGAPPPTAADIATFERMSADGFAVFTALMRRTHATAVAGARLAPRDVYATRRAATWSH